MACITSPGGIVQDCGLIASTLERIKKKNVYLTVCVDTVAASGGYLCASVANEIIASPFSIVGSIGVVAGIPNIHKLLKKYDVDYHLFTAGKCKRTVEPFTEVTEEKKQKMQEKLNQIHHSFKDHVLKFRPQLHRDRKEKTDEKEKSDEIFTGDWWLGKDALQLKLVDKLMTSEEYLNELMEKENYSIIIVKEKKKDESIFKSFSQFNKKKIETLIKHLFPSSFFKFM